MKYDEKKDGMLSIMINICTRVVTMIFIVITLFRNFFSPSGELYMGISGESCSWELFPDLLLQSFISKRI